MLTPDRLWSAGAALLFACVTAALFAGVWHDGFDRVVPTKSHAHRLSSAPSSYPTRRSDLVAGVDLNLSDQRFVVWAVARNAYALLHHPTRIFDAEPCYPARGTLALSPPLITLGALGVPVYALGGDPVTIYNAVVMAIDWISAFAMFLLIRAWTGSPAAGIAAGLLFAFHPAKIGLGFVTRPMITDTGWTVLALFFATRFFSRGRWADALGLAAACSAQLAVSFYPLLAASILAVPMGVWLIAHHGVGRIRKLPLAAALALIAVAAYQVLGPYLALGERPGGGRDYQMFATWWTLRPGGYIGWTAVAFAALALVLPRRRVLAGIDGDPRWALVVAGVAIALFATNGNAAAQLAAARGGEAIWAAPPVYSWLAALVPGLDMVRVPAHLVSGVHLVVCILAGLGAAGLLSLLPRRLAPWSELGVVAVALVSVLLTLPRYRTIEMRPSENDLAFFRALERLDGGGPLFEAPIRLDWVGYAAMDASAQVLFTAYHHRRTSGCYTSFAPDFQVDLERIASELPSPEAVRELRELGFTTIIAHRTPDTRFRKAFFRSLRAASRKPGDPLRPLLVNHDMAAFAIAE